MKALQALRRFGLDEVPSSEQHRLRIANVLAALGAIIGLSYSAVYVFAFDSVESATLNAACSLAYLLYFPLLQQGHARAARLAACLAFLLQMTVLTLLIFSKQSQLQFYFVVAGPIAFILFDPRDRALCLLVTALSLVCYLVCELWTVPPYLTELPPLAMRGLALSAMPTVMVVLLVIEGAFHEEIRIREAALDLAARTDPLTGLLNRRAFFDVGGAAHANAWRYRQPLAIAMIDIDHFKDVNDRHGHDGGDRVLAAIAAVIGESVRRGDTVARFGGEEFIVLLPMADRDAAGAVAQKLRESIAALRVASGHGEAIVCTASVGVSVHGPREANIDATIVRADRALYRAKREGRNRVEFEVPVSEAQATA